MPFLACLIPVVAVAGMALLVYFGWHAAKKRRAALAALAADLGWTFHPQHDHDHDDQYAHFEIFRRGDDRIAYNTLIGTIEVNGAECPAKAGDFQYEITRHDKDGRKTTTYNFSYLVVHLPWRTVPDLLVRAEGVFDKLAGVFGYDDIDFESAEFSRRFYVRSPDKRFAYDVVHPRMMEFLLAAPPPCVDLEHGRCCLSDGSSQWTPDEFRGAIAWIRRFFGLWPEHLTATLE